MRLKRVMAALTFLSPQALQLRMRLPRVLIRQSSRTLRPPVCRVTSPALVPIPWRT